MAVADAVREKRININTYLASVIHNGKSLWQRVQVRTQKDIRHHSSKRFVQWIYLWDNREVSIGEARA